MMTDTAIRPFDKILGEFISIIFHPLFIPGYITAFLLYVHPFAFVGASAGFKILKLLQVVISTCFFPAFTVMLLKQLGFISSIRLPTMRDRIIPIVASMVFYFWVFYVIRKQGDNPPELTQMLCAVFVSSIIALTLNNFMKLSLHGIAMGILVTFFTIMAWQSLIPMGMPLALALLIAGLTGTARLMVQAHTVKELLIGFSTGILSMLIGYVAAV
ncbi:hypothetical protein [Flavihumibacter petaseus]|uniref:Phosphatidic acid phosphatase type 2/haloperoxidase domain-containing protein n=1 Tax=Flavihumibacter petaseus NBRC 106054 TaxID=1220578 RepID=A0A0E9MZ30_9BACT|nr:hypothetical protein [Flavihumibacter petaseus]GAO42803.1 hypothetical protein FPE01S_01_18210 [Flavihumibacter petaseus NBRC 106054]